MIKITGQYRNGSDFKLTVKPSNMANATFVMPLPDKARVTRRLTDLLELSIYSNTPVIANWHGNHRTDAFSTTIGELRQRAKAWA